MKQKFKIISILVLVMMVAVTFSGCVEDEDGKDAYFAECGVDVDISTGKIKNTSHYYANTCFETNMYDPGYPITPFILFNKSFSVNDTIVLRVGMVNVPDAHRVTSIEIQNISNNADSIDCAYTSSVNPFWSDLKNYGVLLQFPVSYIVDALGYGGFRFKMSSKFYINEEWVHEDFYTNNFYVKMI